MDFVGIFYNVFGFLYNIFSAIGQICTMSFGDALTYLGIGNFVLGPSFHPSAEMPIIEFFNPYIGGIVTIPSVFDNFFGVGIRAVLATLGNVVNIVITPALSVVSLFVPSIYDIPAWCGFIAYFLLLAFIIGVATGVLRLALKLIRII